MYDFLAVLQVKMSVLQWFNIFLSLICFPSLCVFLSKIDLLPHLTKKKEAAIADPFRFTDLISAWPLHFFITILPLYNFVTSDTFYPLEA